MTGSLIAFGIGMVLGFIFFGGLWLTVRRLPRAKSPALLSVTSMVGRAAIVCAGFYLVAGNRWERFLIALAGFLVVRFTLVRRLGPAPAAPSRRGDAGGADA